MLDKELLLAINGCHNHLLDTIMVFASSKFGWIPLYLILLYIIIKNFGLRSWTVFVVIALAIALSDLSSVYLFKNVFQRLRPCHNNELAGLLHLVKPCGGNYGFLSSHAANSFSLAFLIILLLKDKHRWIWPVMIIYAIIIIYSRVYLGVHYPTDVIAGAILGAIIGTGCYYLFVIVQAGTVDSHLSKNKDEE